MQFGQPQDPTPTTAREGQSFAPGMYGDPRAGLKADVGQFMSGVMGWMAAGLGVTALVSMFLSTNEELLVALVSTPLWYVALFGPLVYVWIMQSRLPRMTPKGATFSFLLYSAMIGVMLAPLVAMYIANAPNTLVACFLGTSGMFAGMAAFGYLTKRDLSAFGRFFTMMIFGLLAMYIVSFFVPGVSWFVAVIGLPLFAGLTAYDTQKIKQMYLERGGQGNLAILGALHLYIDFINMFLFMLRLMGGNRD